MIRIFFKTIPRSLNWLLAAAIVALMIKVFIFNRIPEPFLGMRELGVIVEGVLGSVIASYVFYLIVVHLKEISDKRVIYPYVTRWTKLVVGECERQLAEMTKQVGTSLDLRSLTQDQIDATFRQINPRSNAPLMHTNGQYANWLQYFQYCNERTQSNIQKTMSQLIYLDAALVAHLTGIDDCTHFASLSAVINLPLHNQDLSAFAPAFFEYCMKCKDLDTYLRSHVAHANTM